MDRTENPDFETIYRAIIDELVASTPSLAARLLREEGLVGRAADDTDANEMVGRLGAADRALLGARLDRERESAFHDALATLTWWMDCREVTWARAGQPMPAGCEGGLHPDDIGRRVGWEWPPRER
jgi:hypothetical protein